jgi:hypothetical protein
MSSPDWRGSPETKKLFKRLKKHCIRLILCSKSDLDNNNTLMINAEYDQATMPTKRETPIEISADEFYNNQLHHGFMARSRCYLHPEINWLQEPMKMFRGISLTELTQLEKPENTSNYSPIARWTQEACEDEIDFLNKPWRIKPMIITKARQNEFTERITRDDYSLQRLCGIQIRGMNAMLYWILKCQKVTYETYHNLTSEVDFYVNDLYMSLNAEGRRRIPIQCSVIEWEDNHIKVGIDGNEVQIRESDDDSYGPHSDDDGSEDEDPVDPHHSAGLVEEDDDIDIDACEAKVFTRFYWCEPRTDEVE